VREHKLYLLYFGDEDTRRFWTTWSTAAASDMGFNKAREQLTSSKRQKKIKNVIITTKILKKKKNILPKFIVNLCSITYIPSLVSVSSL
jgi:hypothetical protein